ncbi:MAG: hypothetical protein EH225_02660 [Calditrichaeota bacterium]|nr:hypothetical protein [Calditrichota bacterium]RQW06948.1 MAG: hypothetical protein EH225_02660 [Calditrichota bacterium]
MKQHITVVGILNIIMGALGILGAIVIITVFLGSAILSGDQEAFPILVIVGTVIAGFLVIISAPSIIGGVGLLRMKEWARIVVLVVSFLNLLNIPFGTALGIYSIWVLLSSESIELFNQERTKT